MTTEAFVHRHRDLACRVARHYFIPGADRDDVEQEAMVALIKAARTMNPDLVHDEAGFAAMCVRRHLVTAIRHARTPGRLLLTEAKRSAISPTGEEVDAPALLLDRFSDPADLAEQRAEIRSLVQGVRALPELERAAIVGFAFEGRSYAEIEGADTSRGAKVVDNALYRARKRLAA